MYCGNCGKKNPDTVKFCAYCGKPLNSNKEDVKQEKKNVSESEPKNKPYENIKLSTGCVLNTDLQNQKREYKDYTIYTNSSRSKNGKVKTGFNVWFWFVFVFNLLRIMPVCLNNFGSGLTGLIFRNPVSSISGIFLIVLVYSNIFSICSLLFYKKRVGFYMMIVIEVIIFIIHIIQIDGIIFPLLYLLLTIIISVIFFNGSKDALD